ncbi:hypothetical protein C2845_PM07G12670 [Panicum miliaceum]|uniref:Uncharacterized protein n=1 Tax=Panicum miliaceum TaxID=4540 RepID=A0A3L6SK76_PANMI|nr:hypothetical protein C2845_PM07G12670 [Panicum miliaceum]
MGKRHVEGDKAVACRGSADLGLAQIGSSFAWVTGKWALWSLVDELAWPYVGCMLRVLGRDSAGLPPAARLRFRIEQLDRLSSGRSLVQHHRKLFRAYCDRIWFVQVYETNGFRWDTEQQTPTESRYVEKVLLSCPYQSPAMHSVCFFLRASIIGRLYVTFHVPIRYGLK